MRRRVARLVVSMSLVCGAIVAAALASPGQITTPRVLDEASLRPFAGVYQWGPDAFVYLQLWSELAGKNQLVAFDESGDVRTLYGGADDRFVTGPGAAVSAPVESQVTFQRGAAGTITSMTWQRGEAAPRVAQRVAIESREDVRFTNGDVRLAGTLTAPASAGRHPAIILVHASGAEDREYLLPLAHFLVRHGVAVLGYDKRGVGQSTGDWNVASFDDLAGDVVSAFAYLRTRSDIDPTHIGLLGWSQAGWVMPIAANRARGVAFLISISGAGLPAAETTIEQARNEMTANGMPAPAVAQVMALMALQYTFARTGEGWDEYAAARAALAARMGTPPASLPGTRDDPYWAVMRRLYFYDPAPALRQLQQPVLALFGERDNNIVAERNRAAWEAALEAGGNRDHTLRIVPGANHAMLEARVGNNAEMASLQRFVPVYFSTVTGWLASRVPGVHAGP